MTKDQLAKATSDSLYRETREDIRPATVKAVIDHVMGNIQKALKQGEPIYLRGFGTFKIVERKAKVARDLGKNEPLEVPARKIVKFKISKQFTL